MSLTMSYPPNDFSLPYLVDTSGNPYASTEQLTAGGWLFENPFLPGQPVTLAGFGPGTGFAMGTGTGTGGVGVGMGTSSAHTETGTSTGVTGVAAQNWNNGTGDVKEEYSTSMPSNSGWNGAGLLDISTEPSPLDFPYPPSASTSQSTTSAPPFPNPFYGNITPSTASTTADPMYGAIPMSQQWETPDMVPAPLDISSFSNFPSRSMPTGARYDQLLQAKLGGPAGAPTLAPAAPITTPMSARSYASSVPPSLGYAQPQFDVSPQCRSQAPAPWLGTTTQTSTTATPTSINTSQTTLSMSLAVPPSSALPIGPYSAPNSTAGSPNHPSSLPAMVQQQQLQQGLHYHPAPMSLASGVHFYRLVDPQSQHAQGLPRVPEMEMGRGAGVQGQPQWNYQQHPGQQLREQSGTPTQFGEKEAGPSRASSYPYQPQAAPPPQIPHSQSQPVPLVSHHSDPTLRSSPLGYYGWQQVPSADSLTPTSASSSSHPSSYRPHPQHEHQTRVQSLAHIPSQSPHPQMHQPNFTPGYPHLYPQLHPSQMPPGMYQPWGTPMPPDASADPRAFNPASGPPSVDRSPAALESARSRSNSSFLQSVGSSPAPVKREEGAESQPELKPQFAQRKRRKLQPSDAAGGSGKRGQGGSSSMANDSSSSQEARKASGRQIKGQVREQEEERKIIIACHTCRAKKLKCDGGRPRCHNCERKDEPTCSYDARLKRRGQGKKTKEKLMLNMRNMDISVGRSTSSVSSRPVSGRRRSHRGGGERGETMTTTAASSRAVSPSYDTGGPSITATVRASVKVEVDGS